MAYPNQDKCSDCSKSIPQLPEDASHEERLCDECHAIHETSNMSHEDLLRIITNDSTVNDTIKNAATETPDEEWTVIDIAETVHDATDLSLNIEDVDLFGKLLKYFNGKQVEFASQFK